LNNPSGVRVIHNSRKKNVFELDIKQPKSFVNGKSYVDAELSCKINNKTLKHDFAFDI
jgi:hypothetical protein